MTKTRERFTSRVRASVGRMIGDRKMERKGKADHASAVLKDKLASAEEHIGHAVDHAKKAVVDARKGR